jgi:hypothetical protein
MADLNRRQEIEGAIITCPNQGIQDGGGYQAAGGLFGETGSMKDIPEGLADGHGPAGGAIQTIELIPGAETTEHIFPFFKACREALESLFSFNGDGIQHCQDAAAHGLEFNPFHGLDELVFVTGAGAGFEAVTLVELPLLFDPPDWLEEPLEEG